MRIPQFFIKLFYARQELANAWLVVLAPSHFVLAIVLISQASSKKFAVIMGGWIVLTVLAGFLVFVSGLNKATKPAWYIVVFWLCPLVLFSLWHGASQAVAERQQYRALSPTRLVSDFHHESDSFLLTPRFRWTGDRDAAGDALLLGSSSVLFGFVQFFLSVLWATDGFIYVMFISTWLFQIPGEKA